MTNTINLNKKSDFILQNFADLNTQRIISIALPFISLYSSKASSLISVGMGAYQFYTLLTDRSKETTTQEKWSQATLLASSTALGYFKPGAQFALSNAVFFLTEAHDLYANFGNWKKNGQTVLETTQHLVYLASIYYGTPALVVCSLLSQAAKELFNSYQYAINQKNNQKPEAVAQFLLATIRLYQANSLLFPQKDLQKQDDDLPVHPIKKLSLENIEQETFILTDVKGNKYDFGAYFHGYGKNIVKGANICFKKEEKGIQLSFKLNHLYRKRLQQIIEGFLSLSDQEREEFVARSIQQGPTEVLLNYETAPFPTANHSYIENAGHEIILKNLGSFVVGNNKQHQLRDHVKLTLKEGSTLQSYHRVLSIFGLEDALKKSSHEDLERLKMGTLFQTFFPRNAFFLEKTDAFYQLPLEKLKAVMISEAPKMEEIFKTCSVEKTELFPGYIRYGVPVDKRCYQLGARGLTASVYLRDLVKDEPSTMVDKLLNHVANLVKNGFFSQEMREMNGLQEKGLNSDRHYKSGGARSVYTQMITDWNLANKSTLEFFAYKFPVRFYFSLSSLNRGSYQYFHCLDGTRNKHYYNQRPTIFEFIEKGPSSSNEHEVMIPDRILKEEIKGLFVSSQTLKKLLIEHLRKCNLIERNERFQEVINGIPIDEFIQTDPTLTYDTVKHCVPK